MVLKTALVILFLFCCGLCPAQEIKIAYIANTSSRKSSVLDKFVQNRSGADLLIHCGNFIAGRLRAKNALPAAITAFDAVSIGKKELSFGVGKLINLLSEKPYPDIVNTSLEYCDENSCYIFGRPDKSIKVSGTDLFLAGFTLGNTAEKGLKINTTLGPKFSAINSRPGVKILMFNSEKASDIGPNAAVVENAVIFINSTTGKKFEKKGNSYIILLDCNAFIKGVVTLIVEDNRIIKAENKFTE